MHDKFKYGLPKRYETYSKSRIKLIYFFFLLSEAWLKADPAAVFESFFAPLSLRVLEAAFAAFSFFAMLRGLYDCVAEE